MKSIPLFISSTFRDFDRERDCLLRRVVPALDLELRPLGARMRPIDLRWGVAHDEADEDRRLRRAMQVCLERIRMPGTIFVGLIGDRYGSVPDADLALRFISDWSLPAGWLGSSITALECRYAAETLGASGTGSVVYFLRNIVGQPPAYFRDGAPAVEDLRRDLAATPNTTAIEYEVEFERPSDDPSLAEFEVAARRALLPLALAQGPRDETSLGSPYERRRLEAVELFEQHHVLRAEEVDVVSLAERGPVVVSGDPGVGVSTVALAVALEFEARGRRVFHYAAEWSPPLDRDSALATIFGVPDPTVASALTAAINKTLAEGAVVVIDGVEHLDSETGWNSVLAAAAQHHPGLVLTAKVGSDRSSTLRSRLLEDPRSGASEVVVRPFSTERVAAFLESVSEFSGKVLPAAARRAVTSAERTPQWLTLMIGQLDQLGLEDYENLDDQRLTLEARLEQLVAQMTDAGQIVNRVLRRCATRLGDDALTCLAYAYDGLSWHELCSGFGWDELDVAILLQAAAGAVVERASDGVIHLPSETIRSYVQRGTTAEAATHTHRRLAGMIVPTRERIDSLLWHALRVNDPEMGGGAIAHVATFPIGSDADRSARAVFASWYTSQDMGDESTPLSVAVGGLASSSFARLIVWLRTFRNVLPLSSRQRLARELSFLAPRDAGTDFLMARQAMRDLDGEVRQIESEMGLIGRSRSHPPKFIADWIRQRES